MRGLKLKINCRLQISNFKFEERNKMKKSLKSLLTVIGLVCAFSLAGVGVGCASAPAGATADQQAAVAAQNAKTISRIALSLKTASRGAAAVAILKDPKNRENVQLAVTALNTFLVGTDYSPGALSSALKNNVKEVGDPQIQIAVDMVIDLYEAAWGEQAKGKIAQNAIAAAFLNALRDGAQEALDATAQHADFQIKRTGSVTAEYADYADGKVRFMNTPWDGGPVRFVNTPWLDLTLSY
jgi:hypothetical protein